MEQKVQSQIQRLEEVNKKQIESYEQSINIKKEELKLLHDEKVQLHESLSKKDQEVNKLMAQLAEVQDKYEQLNQRV